MHSDSVIVNARDCGWIRSPFRGMMQGGGDCVIKMSSDLQEPPEVITPGSEPSWFGFPLSVRPTAMFTRRDLVRHLAEHSIGTRQLFGGNLPRQPACHGRPVRVADDLPGTDYIMRHTFWLGVYPGLSDDLVDRMIDVIAAYCR